MKHALNCTYKVNLDPHPDKCGCRDCEDAAKMADKIIEYVRNYIADEITKNLFMDEQQANDHKSGNGSEGDNCRGCSNCCKVCGTVNPQSEEMDAKAGKLQVSGTIDQRLNTYDWESVFGYARPSKSPVEPDISLAPFTREDVLEVLSLSEGDYDGDNWLGAFLLKDGRFAILRAGCDYTGWDCQASGSAEVASSFNYLVRYCMSTEEANRLDIVREAYN